jgi:hypothetical protein
MSSNSIFIRATPHRTVVVGAHLVRARDADQNGFAGAREAHPYDRLNRYD